MGVAGHHVHGGDEAAVGVQRLVGLVATEGLVGRLVAPAGIGVIEAHHTVGLPGEQGPHLGHAGLDRRGGAVGERGQELGSPLPLRPHRLLAPGLRLAGRRHEGGAEGRGARRVPLGHRFHHHGPPLPQEGHEGAAGHLGPEVHAIEDAAVRPDQPRRRPLLVQRSEALPDPFLPDPVSKADQGGIIGHRLLDPQAYEGSVEEVITHLLVHLPVAEVGELLQDEHPAEHRRGVAGPARPAVVVPGQPRLHRGPVHRPADLEEQVGLRHRPHRAGLIGKRPLLRLTVASQHRASARAGAAGAPDD